MRSRRTAVGRAVAALAVAGAMVLGPLGLAPADADLSGFSSVGDSVALSVEIDLRGLPDTVQDTIGTEYAAAYEALPAEVQAELPAEFPFHVHQKLVSSTSDARQANDGFFTKAESVLGKPGSADAFGLDLGSVTADAVGESESATTQTFNLPPTDAGLDAGVVSGVTGDLLAQVAAGPVVDADATLARVDATLVNAISLLPEPLKSTLEDAITVVLDEVNGALDGAEGTLSDTVKTIGDEAGGLLGGTPLEGPVGGVLEEGQTLGDNLVGALGEIEISNPFTSTLATVTDVSAVTNAKRTGADLVSADSHSLIKSVEVLGGFLSVNAIDLKSHSEAAGTAGSAKASGDCSLADVRLGDVAGVSLDGTNLYVDVNGEPVAVPVAGDAVNDLKGEVDTLLAQAGVSVELCSDTKTSKGAGTAAAAEDGTSASHSVSAFIVTVEPKVPAGVDLSALGLEEGDSFFKVVIDPTVSTAVSAQQAQVIPTSLPRTGAGILGTLITGLLLAGGALAIRRRMR